MTISDISLLGFGLGFRAKHFPDIIEGRPPVDWFEIISENYMNTEGRAKSRLEALKAHYPIALHGVSMSIGTVDPLNSEYLKKLKALIQWVEPAWVSDHLCWTGVAHKNTHDLLPVPYTEEALTHITQRIKEVQDYLERPLILENPSTYLEFTSSAMPEAEFIARMSADSGCGLLLDVNNVYVSCFNHRLDPKRYIDTLPLENVVQIHLSGHRNKGTHIVDTHDDHVIDEVWALYRYVIHKAGLRNTMIEWDDRIPGFDVLVAELDKARVAANFADSFAPLPTLAVDFPANISNEFPPLAAQQETLQEAIFLGNSYNSCPESWIRSKPDFAPKDQLQVYINAYRLRLDEIVAEDFPVLKNALGKAAFDTLIRNYVEATPSTTFDAAKYPDAFPDFVKKAHPQNVFIHEISILENAVAQIMHWPETPALTPEHLSGITPETLLEQVLYPRTALQLFAFTYPVNRYYANVMEEKNPPLPAPENSYLAVFRHQDAVWRLPLDAAEYSLLQQLFAGSPIGTALEAVDATNHMDESLLAMQLNEWFGKWMRNGLLAAH